MNIDIAYRLSQLRRNKGYSQEALAAQLGVSRQAVSKWERAESSPDTDNLIALADLYGMSLDDLLKGEAENASSAEGTATDAAVGSDGAASVDDATGCARAAGPDGVSDDGGHAAASSAMPGDGKDHVHINWRDGINVLDKTGAEVHVGWGGIHVDDPGEDAHVHIGPGGMNVQDGENDIHSDPEGGYTVNGTHYDSWKDAHEAVKGHAEEKKGWMSGFPYGLLALIAFLLMGIFAGMWIQGFVVLLTAAIWYSIAHAVDMYREHASARKRREAVTGIIGTISIFSFLAVGFLLGLWHPGWVLILIGFAGCAIVNACWKPAD